MRKVLFYLLITLSLVTSNAQSYDERLAAAMNSGGLSQMR